VLGNWSQLTRGPKTFFGVPSYTTIWWALGWSVVAILVARMFRESGTGLRLRASRTDLLASRAVGVDVTRARLAAWVLSAGLAAVSGALYAHLILAFAPEQFFFDLTFLLLVMAIVGGPSVSGAVVGAAGISIVTEFLRRREAGFSVGPIHVHEAFGLTTLVLGILVLATVILRPEGLLGRWELDEWIGRLRARWRRGTSASDADAALEAEAAGDAEDHSADRQATAKPSTTPGL
jgi:branched-chain amino acid transport system permease protein